MAFIPRNSFTPIDSEPSKYKFFYCLQYNLLLSILEWRRLKISKKSGDTKGTIHTKIDTVKDKNGKDLTEAKEINKKWQEYTEELYKKALNDPVNCDDVVTHFEQDIMQCELK